MNILLKDLDKTLKKILKNIVRTLTTGKVPNQIETQILDDIKLKMSLGKMPNGNGGIKNAPRLTKATKKVYRSKGVRETPRFEFTSELVQSLRARRKNFSIIFESRTDEGKDKLKWLKNSTARNGKPKKQRIVMGWTRTRSKMIKKIISNALKEKLT